MLSRLRRALSERVLLVAMGGLCLSGCVSTKVDESAAAVVQVLPEAAPIEPIVEAKVAEPKPLGPRPGQPVPRTGDEIMVAGQLFHTGTPVVLWVDPEGYDGYRVERRFAAWARSDGQGRDMDQGASSLEQRLIQAFQNYLGPQFARNNVSAEAFIERLSQPVREVGGNQMIQGWTLPGAADDSRRRRS